MGKFLDLILTDTIPFLQEDSKYDMCYILTLFFMARTSVIDYPKIEKITTPKFYNNNWFV